MGKLLTILGVKDQSNLPPDIFIAEDLIIGMQTIYENSPESPKKDVLAKTIAETIRLILQQIKGLPLTPPKVAQFILEVGDKLVSRRWEDGTYYIITKIEGDSVFTIDEVGVQFVFGKEGVIDELNTDIIQLIKSKDVQQTPSVQKKLLDYLVEKAIEVGFQDDEAAARARIEGLIKNKLWRTKPIDSETSWLTFYSDQAQKDAYLDDDFLWRFPVPNNLLKELEDEEDVPNIYTLLEGNYKAFCEYIEKHPKVKSISVDDMSGGFEIVFVSSADNTRVYATPFWEDEFFIPVDSYYLSDVTPLGKIPITKKSFTDVADFTKWYYSQIDAIYAFIEPQQATATQRKFQVGDKVKLPKTKNASANNSFTNYEDCLAIQKAKELGQDFLYVTEIDGTDDIGLWVGLDINSADYFSISKDKIELYDEVSGQDTETTSAVYKVGDKFNTIADPTVCEITKITATEVEYKHPRATTGYASRTRKDFDEYIQNGSWKLIKDERPLYKTGDWVWFEGTLGKITKMKSDGTFTAKTALDAIYKEVEVDYIERLATQNEIDEATYKPKPVAKKGERKSPTTSANDVKAGTKMKGNDGNMWVSKKTTAGYNQWQKVK